MDPHKAWSLKSANTIRRCLQQKFITFYLKSVLYFSLAFTQWSNVIFYIEKVFKNGSSSSVQIVKLTYATMSVNASVALQLTWLVNVGSCESLLPLVALLSYIASSSIDSKSSVHSSSSVAQRSHYWPLAQSMVKLQYRGVPRCADVAAAVARRARFLCATSAQVKQAAKVLKLEKRNLGFGRATNYLLQ